MNATRSIRERPPSADEDRLPANLHPVLRRILLSRGITRPESLDLSLEGLLRPDGLGGLQQAAQRLADAVMEDQRILVVGDFDADGATGTALAVGVLGAMGAKHVDFRVPNRFEFGYGLSVGLVDSLDPPLPDVLITVDSGICCLDGVARAGALGVDVIVTDHHLPGETMPDAVAIVNPNVPGDDFPSKALAGVGVVFYLLAATRSVLTEAGWFTGGRRAPNLADWLDLVALGTVADLVPLDRNNRVLVSQGLERIRAGRGQPGVMALLRAAGRDYRHVQAGDLGFGVAPRLNAAGRLEDMATGIRCLLAEDTFDARDMAEQLDALNQERRDLQQRMQDEAFAIIDEQLASLEGRELPLGLVLFDPDWHQGVVGLVASKTKDRIHRPVVAMAPEEAGSERLKGSARSVRGLHIRDVLARVDAREPGLMDAFGGHAMAAGMSLPRARLESFEWAFVAAVDEALGGALPEAEWLTDGELTAEELNLPFATALQRLGPWGQRFPEPLFQGSFEVVEHRVVGGAHLKMMVVPIGGDQPLDAIAFGRLPEDLPQQGLLNCLYRLDVNVFRGRQSCQLRVEEIL